MPDPDEFFPVTPALTSLRGVSRGNRRVPPEAWTEALTVRSYEAGRDGAVRPGVILRYLESLATHASAELGFDNRWYRDHSAAWVVREMSLLLGARATIDDDLRLYTWVSDFRRVQATRDYLITHGHTGRLVARAQARWAYIDRLTGQPTRIPDELSMRMGPWGHGMRPRRPQASHVGLAASGGLSLVARQYEADTQGHVNNCVYLDWFDDAASQGSAPNHRRPRFFRLEYIRPTLPGDALTIYTTPVSMRSRGAALWQWITPADGDTPIARAWSEWLTAPAPTNSDTTL
jgi:acyl-CoA thioesterase FadM